MKAQNVNILFTTFALQFPREAVFLEKGGKTYKYLLFLFP